MAVSQLSCLKTLFAACPTDVGVCGLDVGGQGLGGQAGSGGSFGAVYCFASGITVATQTQTSACPAEFTGTWDTEWEVHKPDGSVCYTYSRRRDCGDEAEVFTIRDRSGAIVGSGMSSVVASPQATRWFTCANGDSCQGDYCEPFVPLPNDGCAAAVCP